MRYALLTVVIVVAVTALLVAAVALVGRRVKALRVARRQRARELATWQDTITSKNGHTMVLVQKIARDGSWSEVLDQQFIGKVDEGRTDFDVVLDELWSAAKKRVYQLNTGPLM